MKAEAVFLIFALIWMSPRAAFGQWSKTIDCPPDRVYRDLRIDAGRDEFCVRELPGDLWVRDGPSRWWYSEGHFGEEGTYKNGRKVGLWKECTRFDKCRLRNYEIVDELEKQRGVKASIPVSYSEGKYRFDFGACWSTWVTRQTSDAFVELNIGGSSFRCDVTYIPSTQTDRPAGNEGHYLCEIPYAVGVRRFESLNLRAELLRAGLPQFCRKDEPNGFEFASPIQVWTITRDTPGSPPTQRALADMVDVECAAVRTQSSGPPLLSVRLNKYAEKLLLDQLALKTELKTNVCGGKFEVSPAGTSMDGRGRTMFQYALSESPRTASSERACIEGATPLRRTCETK